MSLARAADDPVLRQRYEDLALDFTQNVGGQRDLDITAPPAVKKSQPDCPDKTRLLRLRASIASGPVRSPLPSYQDTGVEARQRTAEVNKRRHFFCIFRSATQILTPCVSLNLAFAWSAFSANDLSGCAPAFLPVRVIR
jgi:hypothetical protein